jgi:hypothetical protein
VTVVTPVSFIGRENVV